MVNCIWKTRIRKTRKGKLEGRARKETKKKEIRKKKKEIGYVLEKRFGVTYMSGDS